MKKDRNKKRRLQLNKLTKQERAMKEAKKAAFAHPVDSARVLMSSKGSATKAPLNRRLIALILAIVMVVGLIPAGIFMLRPKAETTNLDPVEMTVRVNNDYYGKVTIPAGQIEDNIGNVTNTLTLPAGCTFERAIMEDTSHIPATVSTIAAVGAHDDTVYYSLDADTNTGTRLEDKQNLVLIYSNTYHVTKNATNGSIESDDELRHGNRLHVTLIPEMDHSVSANDVTYTIAGTEYHPSSLNNNSFTISAAEIVGDITISVDFPAISEYTIQDAHSIANADSKYYNLYGEDGHGGITQGRGQSAAGNPSDNHRSVFKDYTYSLITPSASTEMRNNPKYLNWTTTALDFSDSSNYQNLYQKLGYNNIEKNNNNVITNVLPNNVSAGQPAEFVLYSQSWSGNTAWILDSLSINGEYINFPDESEIADPNNKPTEQTTLTKGNMAGTVVTVTLDEVGGGLYWKSLDNSGSYDPDVTYRHSTSNQKTYSYNGNSEVLDIWQLNTHKKSRTYYKITLSEVHDNLEVAYNFKDSSERTIVISDMEGIESAFAAQEHRGLIGNIYDRFYSVPVDSRGNLQFDAHNEYPAYYQERHNNLFRIPSNNLYLYQVKPGYNPYTVEATAKYYQDNGDPIVISSNDSEQHIMLAEGGGLPGDVIKNASQKGLEQIDESWPSELQSFVSALYDFDSGLRYWGGSNSDGGNYALTNASNKKTHTDVPTQQHDIPLLLESIADYENAVKDSKSNYRFYAIALLENEAMTQELKLKATPFEYHVLFDLNGGSYDNVPAGLVSTDTTGVYARGKDGTPTIYTLANGATSTNMPKGEQPTKENSVFLGWRLYKDGVAVTDEGYNKAYASNEVFAIDENSIKYADYVNDQDRNVPQDKGHTFTFKAEWLNKADSNEYATANILVEYQDPNDLDEYITYYSGEETQLAGDAVLLNLHNDFENAKYYTLNKEDSILTTPLSKSGDNLLYAKYDLTLCDLDVTKKVIGSPKTAKEFPITVVLTWDKNSPIDFETAKSLVKPSISSLTPNENGNTLTYTYNFKRSQNLTFKDVPYGWTVTVSEPIAQEKPNGQNGELDYTTTIESDPTTAGSQATPQDGDTATVWEGTLTKDTAVTVTNKSESFLDLTKKLDYGENGTYDLTLTAYANGSISKEAEIVTEQVPTDYVLVVDQSTSMKTNDMPTAYSTAPETDDWVISQSENEPTARYIKVGDDYYRVYRKRGYMYEYFEPDKFYTGDLIETSNLGWFQRESEEDYGADSEFFYNPYLDNSDTPVGDSSDNTFYPLKISVAGKVGYYAIRINYTNRNKDRVDLIYPSQPIYHNPLNGEKFGPGYTILGVDAYSPVNRVVQRWSGNDNKVFTYGEVDLRVVKIKTGMYVRQAMFRRHVGFNQLCYKDKNGKEHVLINATFCDSNGAPIGGSCNAMNDGKPAEGMSSESPAFWHGELYTATAWETRLTALQRSLKKFVNNVASQEDSNGTIDHRIAIVGFSNDSSSYKNSELLTGSTVDSTQAMPSGGASTDNMQHNGPQYGSISNSQYESALLNATTNEDDLIQAADYITAYGGTEPWLGLEMAQNILEKRPEKTYQNAQGVEKDRNTVIVFFTDGQPGNENGDQYAAANQVSEAANSIKTSTRIRNDHEAGKTFIYSVGLFGEADGNPLTKTKRVPGNLMTYKYVTNDRTSNGEREARLAAQEEYLTHPDDYKNIEETYTNGFVHSSIINSNSYFLDTSNGYSTSYEKPFLQDNYWKITGRYEYYYYYRKSLLGETGYPSQQNDTIADYMSVVSSEYPNANSFDPTVGSEETYEEACLRVRGRNIKEDSLNRYYYNATSGDGLDEIFETIASAIPGSNTTITLDASNAVLRDVINGEDFVIPANKADLTYEIWTEKTTVELDEHGAEKQPVDWERVPEDDNRFSDEDIEYDPTTGTINVKGFDYAKNFVGYNKDALEDEHTGDHQGKRIVVKIHGLVPKKEAVGELKSNKDTSGVYKLNDSGAVLLDAFEVPNMYRYAYHLKETGVKTADKFDIEITKVNAPNGILVPYEGDNRSNRPLRFDGQGNSVTWNNAESDDTIFFESLSDDRVELTAEVPSDGLNLTDLTYDVSWQSEGESLDTAFAMYKPNQTIEDSTILVHNVTNYRDLTIDLSVDDSPYVAPGYDFTVDVILTGSKLTDAEKITALNNANAGTGVTFVADGSKLKATLTMPLKENGSIDPIQFKVPDGVEVAVDHSDNYYTTDEPYKYHDDNMDDESTRVDYTPHSINAATTIYIHDTVKDIIESGIMDESNGSHVILYVLAGLAVISGGAGAAYVYRKKDEFVGR